MYEFTVIKPTKKASKTNMLIPLDQELQEWIRRVARENGVTISELMHQVIRFAKSRHSRN